MPSEITEPEAAAAAESLATPPPSDPFYLSDAFDVIINVSLPDLLDRIAEGPVTIEAGSEEQAILTGLAELAASYGSAVHEASQYLREVAVA